MWRDRKNKNPSKFFVPQLGLPPGVYDWTAGSELRQILAFTRAMPTCDSRFDFGAAAEAAALKQFLRHFVRRMAEVLSRVR